MSRRFRRKRFAFELLYCECSFRCEWVIELIAIESYKQNKFNLLREQSEGYSKLMCELTASLGPAHSAATGRPTESLSAIEARAKPTWERVVGLVGYFDLDPNRALDIILDVFSVHIATHYSFFLALLSCSPWATAPKVKTEDTMNVEPDTDTFRDKSIDEILRIAERQSGYEPNVPQPSTFGESTNPRVLAQVLGFKLTYYQVRTSPPSHADIHLMYHPVARCDGAVAEEPLSLGRSVNSRGVYNSGRFIPSCEYFFLLMPLNKDA